MKKKLLALATVCVLSMLSAEAAKKKYSTPAGFTDNLDEALAEAAASGRNVYACFSGSDWCGWCKRLDEEVFSKESFVSSATNNFVLVYIDSPSDKKLLSPRARKENKKLVEKYGIEGFPSALVLDGEGKTIARTGYRRGGPDAYLKHLEALVKNAREIEALKAQIDELVSRVKRLESGE